MTRVTYSGMRLGSPQPIEKTNTYLVTDNSYAKVIEVLPGKKAPYQYYIIKGKKNTPSRSRHVLTFHYKNGSTRGYRLKIINRPQKSTADMRRDFENRYKRYPRNYRIRLAKALLKSAENSWNSRSLYRYPYRYSKAISSYEKALWVLESNQSSLDLETKQKITEVKEKLQRCRAQVETLENRLLSRIKNAARQNNKNSLKRESQALLRLTNRDTRSYTGQLAQVYNHYSRISK